MEYNPIYSDYDTSDSAESNDSDTHIENRFYSNDDASDQTMPTEYMTEETKRN